MKGTTWWWPSSRRQRFCAAWTGLNIMARLARREPLPLGRPMSQANRREGGLDGIRGAQVLPVLG